LLPAAALTAVAHAVSARSGDSMADYRRRRDHAMACLLMSSGMLVSAIRTLRWDNIDPDWCRIRCAAGTPQEQTYQLRGDARQAMLDLRKQANLEDLHSDYCFPSSRGRPLSRQGLCQRIRKFGRDIGVALVVTPTALRRAAPHYYKRRSLYRASAGAG
jgi:site-specific recombinase XerC